MSAETLIRPGPSSHLLNNLDETIEEISGAALAIDAVMATARDAIDELQDLLAFEHERADLAVQKAEWEPKTDPNHLAAMRQWRDRVSALMADYTSEKVLASWTFLGKLKTELTKLKEEGAA